MLFWVLLLLCCGVAAEASMVWVSSKEYGKTFADTPYHRRPVVHHVDDDWLMVR
jgi:hypothetical protein